LISSKIGKSLQSKTDQKRTGNNLSQREKTNEILALTNTLVNLQATLESTKQRTQEKQDAWDRLAVAATSRSLMFVQVKMYVIILNVRITDN
jgi:molecular chaperone GrpE (heat shock protein)